MGHEMQLTVQSAAQPAERSSATPANGTRDGSITVGRLIDDYMARYTGRDQSKPQRLAWWQSQIGHLKLIEVDDDVIFHAVEGLAAQRGRHYVGVDADGAPIFKSKGKPYSNATLNRYIAGIGSVFTWAIRQRLCPRGWESPTRRLGTRPENNSIIRFLDADERERLFAACKASKWKPLFALVLTAITTGSRKGALKALRWRDVDLDAGTAVVERTKNGSPQTMVLTPAVVEELRKLQGPPGALVFGSVRRRDVPFHFEAGVWPIALRKANIKRFRFHDLRHSCASYLTQAGASLVQVADVLNHKNLAVTRRYSHLGVNDRRKLVNAVLGDLK